MGRREKTRKKTQSNSDNDAYLFTQLDDRRVSKEMTVVGLRLKHDLMGISSINFEDVKSKL
jgi:DNA polymerase V